MSQLALAPRPTPKVLLIGNPNVGKSLLFTRLTNRYVTVSNYPRTTVEITTAKAELGGELWEIIDTRGTNGLTRRPNADRVRPHLPPPRPARARPRPGRPARRRPTPPP